MAHEEGRQSGEHRILRDRDKGSQVMLATVISVYHHNHLLDSPEEESLFRANLFASLLTLLILTSGPWLHHHPHLIWLQGCFLKSPFINQKSSLRTERSHNLTPHVPQVHRVDNFTFIYPPLQLSYLAPFVFKLFFLPADIHP